jgi:hypothetical protein
MMKSEQTNKQKISRGGMREYTYIRWKRHLESMLKGIANWMTCIEHEKENIPFGIVP